MSAHPKVPNYSRRIADLKASPIREMLSVIQKEGMISFAGGLPAAESFPDFKLEQIPLTSLQYGASEGDDFLRRQVSEELQALGIDCSMEQVIILSGSQQGLDLVAKLMIDEGTEVLVESPTYLAALQVFRFFGASFRTFPIADLSNIKLGSKLPAFLYSIPTFQNPSGHCYSNSERMALAKFCDDNRILLLEDDPYRDLVFDKCDRKPVVSLLKNSEWIYQGSFSKNLAPGLRLGYLAASKELVPYLVRLKQAADLHSNRLSQWLVNQQLLSLAREQRINDLCDTYRTKRNRFDDALHHYFGDIAIWTKPAGGLFFWLELNRKIDTRLLLPKAIERNVIFMPGENFYADASDGIGTMRLNFSLMDSNQTELGLKRLSELIRLA